MITNPGSKTRVDEVAEYLVVDEEPLLFHTGPRRMFPLVREVVGAVLPVERLRHVGFSHFEGDECGSLNELLAVAPVAAPLCSRIAAMVSVDDVADRPARALADGGAAGPRPPHRALARHAARPARLGVRAPVRGEDAHPFVRGPLHPARGRAPGSHQRRHPGAERGDAGGARLLGARGEHAADAGAAGFASAHDARVHAWVRVDGGWGGADPGVGGQAGDGGVGGRAVIGLSRTRPRRIPRLPTAPESEVDPLAALGRAG